MKRTAGPDVMQALKRSDKCYLNSNCAAIWMKQKMGYDQRAILFLSF